MRAASWGWIALALGLAAAALHPAQIAWLRLAGGDPSVRKAATAMVTPLAAGLLGFGLARGARAPALVGAGALALLGVGDLVYAWVFLRGVVGLDVASARDTFALAHVQVVVQAALLVATIALLRSPTPGRRRAIAAFLAELALASFVSPWVGTPHSEMLVPVVLVLKPILTGASFLCGIPASWRPARPSEAPSRRVRVRAP